MAAARQHNPNMGALAVYFAEFDLSEDEALYVDIAQYEHEEYDWYAIDAGGEPQVGGALQLH